MGLPTQPAEGGREKDHMDARAPSMFPRYAGPNKLANIIPYHVGSKRTPGAGMGL